jgi:hypothetical protein
MSTSTATPMTRIVDLAQVAMLGSHFQMELAQFRLHLVVVQNSIAKATVFYAVREVI